MVRPLTSPDGAGSKRSTSARKNSVVDKSAADSVSWSSCTSVLLLEIFDRPDDEFPIEPPIGQYLDEVCLGMRGYSDDGRSQGDISPAATPQHAGELLKQQVNALLRVLVQDVSRQACRALFLLTLNGVFGRVPVDAIAHIRKKLGMSWYLLALAIKEITEDTASHDWVVAALPFVFAQAIYRLVYDSFEEDRKHFLGQADTLIVKLTLIVHFELTGFQLNRGCVQSVRRNLFQRRVYKMPHINQKEFLKGQKRQVLLESQNDGSRTVSLAFGDQDGYSLDEIQLEHVMQCRADSVRRVQRFSAFEKDAIPFLNKAFPVMFEDLTVDRYSQISQVSDTMLERHLAELRTVLVSDADSMLEDQMDEDATSLASDRAQESPTASFPGSPFGVDGRPLMSWGTPDPDTPGRTSPTSRGGTTKSSPRLSPRSRGGTRDCSPRTSPRSRCGPMSLGSATDTTVGNDDATSDTGLSTRPATIDGGDSSPVGSLSGASPKNKRRWRKGATVAKLNIMSTRDRKEKETKARRYRQDALHQRIAVDDLPSELCTRALRTDWVSSPMSHMTGEEKTMLHKTSAEARSLSMPAPWTTTAKAKAAPGGKNVAVVGMSSPSTPSHRPYSSNSSSGQLGRISPADRAQGNAGSSVDGPTGPERFPRVASASGTRSTPSSPAWAVRRDLSAEAFGASQRKGSAAKETIVLEPPARLSAKVTIKRLEDEATAARQKSFAVYTKEYNVFTDMPKRRFDHKKLREEENAYVRKVGTLVSGEPKKKLPPESLLTRQRSAPSVRTTP